VSRKATTKEIESIVNQSGNGEHVFVPKQWIGKKVRVTLMEKED
jgi:putative transposon-encoded protein